MLTGSRYLHSLGSRPAWLLAPDNGGGGGDDKNDDSGDDDEEVEDDTEDEDDDSDEDLADLPAVLKQLGLKPGQIAGRLQASTKWEKRAKRVPTLERELSDMKNKGLPDEERAIKEAEQRGRQAAGAEHAQQLAGAKIEAALTGIVDDPAEFVEDLNLAKFVTDDGEVDLEAIDALKTKWAARKGTEEADDDDADGGKPPAKKKADLKQGARGKHGKSQLTRADLQNMTPEEIDQAHRDGRLNEIQGIRS